MEDKEDRSWVDNKNKMFLQRPYNYKLEFQYIRRGIYLEVCNKKERLSYSR